MGGTGVGLLVQSLSCQDTNMQRDQLEVHRSAAFDFERNQTAREQVPLTNKVIQPKDLSGQLGR